MIRRILAACMILSATLSPLGVAHAAGISGLSIDVTDETAGATADHTVAFVTPSGVDAPTDSIVLTYGSGADLTGLSMPGDADLGVDDDGACDGPFAAKSLAAVAAVGTWGVSVSGNNVTFTPPTDAAAGEIAAGRCVQIGLAGIVNPASVGSYTLAIAGAFGDSGLGVIAVTDSSEVLVTAIVEAPAGGGGGGGGGSADAVAPTIYNVEISNVSETSAVISWGTDENAESTVQWGTTVSYGDGSQSNVQFLTGHSFELTGLAPGTTYFVFIESTDADGNTASYGPIEFTTPDATSPEIIDAQVTGQTSTTCTVQWLTDEYGTSDVDYGVTTSYEIGTVSDATFVTDHSIVLTGLEPGTVYHIRARSTDASGNEAFSGDVTCTTLVNIPPSNVDLDLTSACGQNALTWTLPSDDDLAGVTVVFATDDYPITPFDGTVIYNQLGTSMIHSGLTTGVTYYYGVFAYDTLANFSSGALAAGTVSCPAEPAEEVGEEVAPTEEPSAPAEEIPAVGAPVSASAVNLYVAGGTIQLAPVTADTYRILTTQPFIVSVATTDPAAQIASAQFSFNGNLYNMTAATTGQLAAGVLVGPVTQSVFGSIAIVEAPAAGTYPATITVTYADGASQTFALTIQVVPFGYVFETIEGVSERLAGVDLELFLNVADTWETWNAQPYIQGNPMTTSGDGEFAWYVPNGVYDVRGSQSGYLDFRTGSIEVADNIVNPYIHAYAIPVEIPEIIASPLPAGEKAAMVLDALLGGANAQFQTARRSEAAEAILEPTSAVAAVALALGFSALAFWFNLGGYLRYLASYPGIFFWESKTLVGLVYSAFAKTAVRCAELRLYLVEKKKTRFLRNAITDERGNYSFGTHEPGLYVIVVRKEGYRYPSIHMQDRDNDGPYRHLYHGELLEVKENKAVIATTIPLDPVRTKEEEHDEKRRRSTQQLITAVAGIASVAVLMIRPDRSTQFLVFLAMLLLLFTKRLTKKVS